MAELNGVPRPETLLPEIAEAVDVAFMRVIDPDGRSAILPFDAMNPGYDTGDTIPPYGGIWSDVGDQHPKIHRFRDRVFVGEAATLNDTRANTGSWFPLPTSGAGFIVRDGSLVSMADLGNIAVAGFSRKADGEDIVSPPATIGVAGGVINNGDYVGSGNYPTVWALYGDIQHEPISGGSSYGLELAVKNKTASRTSKPYAVDSTDGAFGLWLAGGGDNRYGGNALNPANGALMINRHHESGLTSGWNVGINFQNDAITGSTGAAGETGAAPAIQMARAQEIQWYAPTNPTVKAAFIRSQIDDSDNSVGIVFSDGSFALQNRGGTRLIQINHQANAVNYLQILNNITGGSVQLRAQGSDANVDIEARPRGTGKFFTPAPLHFRPGSSVIPSSNGDVTFELTSNTSLTVKARGSDGTVRSVALTLA